MNDDQRLTKDERRNSLRSIIFEALSAIPVPDGAHVDVYESLVRIIPDPAAFKPESRPS